MSTLRDAIIRLMGFEKCFELAAVLGMQRVHQLGCRVLAAFNSDGSSDDSRNRSRVGEWPGSIHQREGDRKCALECNLQPSQKTLYHKRIKRRCMGMYEYVLVYTVFNLVNDVVIIYMNTSTVYDMIIISRHFQKTSCNPAINF